MFGPSPFLTLLNLSALTKEHHSAEVSILAGSWWPPFDKQRAISGLWESGIWEDTSVSYSLCSWKFILASSFDRQIVYTPLLWHYGTCSLLILTESQCKLSFSSLSIGDCSCSALQTLLQWMIVILLSILSASIRCGLLGLLLVYPLWTEVCGHPGLIWSATVGKIPAQVVICWWRFFSNRYWF